MKRSYLFAMVIFCVAALLSISIYAGKEAKDSYEWPTTYKKATKVKFTHKDHAAMQGNFAKYIKKCADCHHTQADAKVGMDINNCSAKGCHWKEDKDKEGASKFNRKTAMHKSCTPCHKKAKDEVKIKEQKLATCNGCHKE
ncbi:MAG: cytochrome c3 family protein [Pseudomonadota bacterium]